MEVPFRSHLDNDGLDVHRIPSESPRALSGGAGMMSEIE